MYLDLEGRTTSALSDTKIFSERGADVCERVVAVCFECKEGCGSP